MPVCYPPDNRTSRTSENVRSPSFVETDIIVVSFSSNTCSVDQLAKWQQQRRPFQSLLKKVVPYTWSMAQPTGYTKRERVRTISNVIHAECAVSFWTRRPALLQSMIHAVVAFLWNAWPSRNTES